jgi:hypothetical protein
MPAIYTGAVQGTNFGPAPGGDTVAAIYPGRQVAAIGGIVPLSLRQNAQVGNSATASIVAEVKAPCRLQIKAISLRAGAITATAQADVYNVTQTELSIALQTLTANAESLVTTISNTIVEKNDVLQLRITTNGTGVADDVMAEVFAVSIGDLDNV